MKNKKKNLQTTMRIWHRYLGYFAAGIMAVYSLSGILLIYRDTDFLKSEHTYEQKLETNFSEEELGKEIKIKKLKFTKSDNSQHYFEEGVYNFATGDVKYTKKELPIVLDKMTKLHKANSGNPWSPLNALFGATLFFFVVSSFWMFNFKSKAFRKGMIYAGIGFILAIIMVMLT